MKTLLKSCMVLAIVALGFLTPANALTSSCPSGTTRTQFLKAADDYGELFRMSDTGKAKWLGRLNHNAMENGSAETYSADEAFFSTNKNGAVLVGLVAGECLEPQTSFEMDAQILNDFFNQAGITPSEYGRFEGI